MGQIIISAQDEAVTTGGGETFAGLASPAFTGTPTAPTAGASTNTTQIATTAFVQQELGGISANQIIEGNSDITVTDAGTGSIDVTVDTAGIADFTASGLRLGGANARVTTVYDTDAMTENSATALATQQSIKAYVDNGLAALSSTTITEGDTSVVVADAGSGTVTITVDAVVSATFSGSDLRMNTGDILPSATSAIQNVGSQTDMWTNMYAAQFHGVATKAQYADLAENYLADAAYEEGTVLSFGGELEVTESTVDGDKRIAGIVSTAPAHLMNSTLMGDFVSAIALSGRAPCKVTGTVRKGDMMVSNGDGTARAEENPQMGQVIGKALEDFDGETGRIEVVVGRL